MDDTATIAATAIYKVTDIHTQDAEWDLDDVEM